MRSRAQTIALSVLVAATLLLSAGCRDINETFTNNSGRTMTELRVWVKIEGAGTTFPAVSSWYNNHVPTVTPQGGGFFLLTWKVRVPPGGSIHVGLTFVDDQKVTLIHHGFWEPVGAVQWSAGMTASPRYDLSQGLVLDVTNASDIGPVTVQQFQWTAHTEHVALNNLDWNDPVLDLLPWEDVTPDLPFDLYPGEVRTFDIPDDLLAGFSHVLARWEAIDPDGILLQQPVVEMPVADLPGPDADGDVLPADPDGSPLEP